MGDKDLTYLFFSLRAKFYYVNIKLEGTSKAVETISSKKGREFNITLTQFQHSEYSGCPKATRTMAGESKGIPRLLVFFFSSFLNWQHIYFKKPKKLDINAQR